MGWFSKFRFAAQASFAAAQPVADADSVQQTRIRSRRRLIGAVVLVVIGVIGFPLVFETQPRPIPVDIPIEIPRKEGAPPLAMPADKPTPPPAATSAPLSVAAPASTATKPAAQQAVEEVIAPGRSPAAASSLPVLKSAEKFAPAAPAASAALKLAVKPSVPADTDRAKALLEAKPVATETKAEGPKEVGRFVVQVGAFAENEAARSTRLKVEKLGLKTYVQVAETAAGKRIRVRVGPYVSKEEAEQARSKLTAGGFPAVLLAL